MSTDFGIYLKEKRLKKGFTISQLSLYSGVSTAQLSRIENGKRGAPKAENIQKIASALSVPYEEMMKVAGYIEDDYKVYLYDVNQSPSEDWALYSIENLDFSIPKGTRVLANGLSIFILDKDMDPITLMSEIAQKKELTDFNINDVDKIKIMGTHRFIEKIDSPTYKTTVAGQEITFSIEELKLFEELKKHPIMFNDLASNPEAKVRELIKLYKMKKMFLEDDDEDLGDGFGELED